MDFLIAAHTDVGIRKKTNQDSVLIKVADTDCGKVCFAAVCDGMGGLRKGELASATLIRDFSDWFDSEFPEILYEGLDTIVLRKSWKESFPFVQKNWKDILLIIRFVWEQLQQYCF